MSLAALVALAVSAVFAYPTIFQLGLTINKPGVQPGYEIFAGSDGDGYAIDVKGQIANKWTSPSAGTEFDYIRPLTNGNLLARLRVKRTSSTQPGGAPPAGADAIVELDQEVHDVWRYIPEPGRFLHHDFERMDNGNTMIVCAREFERPAIAK